MHSRTGQSRRPMPQRVIVTKYQTYFIADDDQGVPIEDYYPGVKWPPSMQGKGIRVYETRNGPVVAEPSQEILEWRQQQPTRASLKGTRGADPSGKKPER
jgi:hypothetical protein